jgi:DNA gyrase subunit A
MEMFIGCTHDYVMFFTNQGRVYRLKGYEIPEGGRTAKGMNLINLLPLADGEKITAMIRAGEFDNESYLCMVTRKGVIKRTRLSEYANARKSGLIAINLDEGDELAWVHITDGQCKLMLGTRRGMSMTLREGDVRVIGRTARGVKAIELAEGDEVVGMEPCEEGDMVLTVTETGYGRLSPISDYRVQNRGGKGLINYHVAQYGAVAAIRVVRPAEEDLICISDDGIIIRIHADEVRVCGRPAKGVRIMRLGETGKLVSLVTAPRDDAEETAHVEAGDADADEGAETAAEAVEASAEEVSQAPETAE